MWDQKERGQDTSSARKRRVEMCKASENTENQAKIIVVDPDEREVHDVKDDSKKPPGKSRRGNGKHNQTKKRFNCRRCGKVHQPQKCTAYGWMQIVVIMQ